MNGIKTPVVVDDWIPHMYNKPRFARCVNGELWVSLLEKAWAKLFGNYMAIRGGLSIHFTASSLTGAPADHYWHALMEDKEALYARIKNADERDHTLMSTSEGKVVVEGSGLVNYHAYSLLAVYEFEHEGEEVRLLKMRNTWGYYEWKGDWSDESPLWTNELRERFGAAVNDDGVFFITYSDYLANFCVTYICANNDPTKWFHS